MEGVFLPGFCDVGLEGPQDVCSDERVASAEAAVKAELLHNLGKRGVLPQAGCDLSAVFDCKQAEVAVALLDHEVVCLPYLFGGGLEGEPGVCEARFGEGGVGAILRAFLQGLCLGEVVGNCLAPGRCGGKHGG